MADNNPPPPPITAEVLMQIERNHQDQTELLRVLVQTTARRNGNGAERHDDYSDFLRTQPPSSHGRRIPSTRIIGSAPLSRSLLSFGARSTRRSSTLRTNSKMPPVRGGKVTSTCNPPDTASLGRSFVWPSVHSTSPRV